MYVLYVIYRIKMSKLSGDLYIGKFQNKNTTRPVVVNPNGHVKWNRPSTSIPTTNLSTGMYYFYSIIPLNIMYYLK